MEIELVKSKGKCCGCGACMNVCPQNAITMEEDEYGFIYPRINAEKCIKCHACINVCAYNNANKYKKEPIKSYAATSLDFKVKEKSASGGIFYELSKKVIETNGIVFGAAMENKNGKLVINHIYVDNLNDLSKLQGSKYVQSNIGNSFRTAKKFLDSGRHVMFCGTPCQILGLKSFLRKEYDNLLTIDIICHGIPNLRFFNDYLKVMSNEKKIIIKDFKFRDKSKGWKHNAKIYYTNNDKRLKSKLITGEYSSYYDYFLKCDSFRENCYSCTLASKSRVSDITLGDYWGIEKEHPELLKNKSLNSKKGISCVIINSQKGLNYLSDISNIFLYESKIEKISLYNGQLNRPSNKGKRRNMVLELYKEKGYLELEKRFKSELHKKMPYIIVRNMVPKAIKEKLKKR